MSDKVRLVDANSVCKKIVESIRCAEKWANEANEQQDTHRLRCATEAKTSLLAMLTRIHDEPTIEAKPVNGWISMKDRRPEPETWAIVYIKYPSPVFELERGIHKMSSVKKMFYDGKSFYCDFGAITHWMPLPEPPKGE